MKYYILAGEASGDLHGANLVRALRARDTHAEIRAWGGDLMQEAGAKVIKHYRELAFMGFVEVVRNLSTIMRNFKTCKSDITDFAPDVLILIDYPGFNLRMATWAKRRGLKVFYYISPQIWAWHTSRVHQIMRDTDRVFAILPFEPAFYRKFGYEVSYFGHPLRDVVEAKAADGDFRARHGFDERPIVALLPGSRKQEIAGMLSLMLGVAATRPAFQFVVAGAPGQHPDHYPPMPEGVRLIFGETYSLLQQSFAALVTSGTATLETAMFRVPQVVCYKSSGISYSIAKRLIKVRFISLVNLIADKLIVKELIQHELNPEQLLHEFDLICSSEHRATMLRDYEVLLSSLGEIGVADRVADAMVELAS